MKNSRRRHVWVLGAFAASSLGCAAFASGIGFQSTNELRTAAALSLERNGQLVGTRPADVVRTLTGVTSVDDQGRPNGFATSRATAAAAAIQCWSVSGRQVLQLFFGVDSAHSHLDVSWCSNGTSLTSHGVSRTPHTHTPSVFFRGWIAAVAQGGNGQSFYRYSTQGTWEACAAACYYQWLPVIGFRVNANGSYSRVDNL